MGEPYTGDATRILLSFAMKSGGHLFSQWLRNKLMKSLNYFSTNSVYLDTVASREHATEHNLVQVDKSAQQAGVTYVAPDRRYEKEEGFTTIGAMNKGWNEAYTKAMSEAGVMVIILTADYLASEWCMKEWDQFQAENVARRSQGRPPLYGLVVKFVGDVGLGSSKPINLDGVDVLLASRVETTGGGMTALRGTGGTKTVTDELGRTQTLATHGTGWAISETSYLEILQKIEPHL